MYRSTLIDIRQKFAKYLASFKRVRDGIYDYFLIFIAEYRGSRGETKRAPQTMLVDSFLKGSTQTADLFEFLSFYASSIFHNNELKYFQSLSHHISTKTYNTYAYIIIVMSRSNTI